MGQLLIISLYPPPPLILQPAGHKSHADHISQPINLSDSWQHPVSLQGVTLEKKMLSFLKVLWQGDDQMQMFIHSFKI